MRVFGEVPDTDYCATAPVDFFLKVSVPLPFAAFGAENQIDKRVGLKIRAQEVSNISVRCSLDQYGSRSGLNRRVTAQMQKFGWRKCLL